MSKRSEIAQDVGPGEIPLYFKNVGLFSDPFLEQLKKGSTNPEIVKNWDTDGTRSFEETYEWMRTTWFQLKDVLPKLSEPQLEEKWIREIFKHLGWVYEVQDRFKHLSKSEIPDYSMFEDMDSYVAAHKCHTNEAYFDHVLAVADAKAMDVPLDGNRLDKSNPSFQIVWYMQATGRKWGILSDGRYWRLYSVNAKSKYNCYYEVNVEKFLTERDDEQFKYFFNFFRKDAFVPDPVSDQSFLDLAFANGESYAKNVELKLKDRAYFLVRQIALGFASGSNKLQDEELANIYEHSLYYLFRLMFILNCESKGLLDVSNTSNYYGSSLRALGAKIKADSNANKIWPGTKSSYNHISELFKLLESGDSNIGIHSMGTEVFSSGDAKFFRNYSINDSLLNPIIRDLMLVKASEGGYQYIDYKRLSADHMGALFEGLLEFKLAYAEKDHYVINYNAVPASEVSKRKRLELGAPHIKVGDLFLAHTSEERSDSGSFYTPDFIVDHVVKQTLGPICEGKTPDELLDLHFIDPAMGSGHFLLGVTKYLEEQILKATLTVGKKSDRVNTANVRWQVLHNCIFGVDMNPLAVELAKFSLWIYTATDRSVLEPLSDQLKNANSLLNPDISGLPKLKPENHAEISNEKILNWETCFESNGFAFNRFSGVVGNPPFGGSLTNLQKKYFKHQHGDLIKDNLNTAWLFCLKALNILDESGRIGFVLPKSLYYSSTWIHARNRVIPCLSHTADVSEAFKDVKLEEIVLVLDESSIQDTVSTSKVSGDEIVPAESIDRNAFRSSGIIFSGYSSDELEIRSHVFSSSTPASDIWKLQRGFLVQNKLDESARTPVLRCKTIGKFGIKDPVDFIKSNDAKEIIAENSWVTSALAVMQNIVAHVTKPTDQIILMAASNPGFVGLDSMSYLIERDENWRHWPKAIIAFMNSWFVSWYMYRFCYSKAIRTMRFDNYHLEKCPVPEKLISSASVKLTKAETTKLEKEIRAFVHGYKGETNNPFAVVFPKSFNDNHVASLNIFGELQEADPSNKVLGFLVDAYIIDLFDLSDWGKCIQENYALRSSSGIIEDDSAAESAI